MLGPGWIEDIFYGVLETSSCSLDWTDDDTAYGV